MKQYRLLFLFLITMPVCASAQFINSSGVGGFLPTPKTDEHRRYENVDGMPYLSDTWGKGVVQLNKGITYKNLDMKFDQVQQQIIFKSTDGKELYFADPVAQFRIIFKEADSVHVALFKTGFGKRKNEFYEVLAEGSIMLLKRTSKILNPKITYPAGASDELLVETKDVYYIYTNDNLVLVKLNQASILQAIGNKQTELLDFIIQNKINFKSDGDLAKLVIFYNSI